MTDAHGTLTSRWMDNGLVFCVSTIHKPGEIIKRTRKRPRKTKLNSRHVDKIFGKNGKAEIFIPTLIDDYNHKIGGVDLVDQRIAYYQPNVRCRRNWIPMFIQTMGIIRNNSYIVHKEYIKRMGANREPSKMCKSHKLFTLQMISELLTMSNRFKSLPTETHGTPDSQETDYGKNLSPPKTLFNKKSFAVDKSHQARHKKVSKEKPDSIFSIFGERFTRPRSLHVPVSAPNNSRSRCVWCKVLWAEKESNGIVGDYQKEVKKTRKICSFCSTKVNLCFLCDEHFSLFHDPSTSV